MPRHAHGFYSLISWSGLDSGLIVIDLLISTEVAAAARALYFLHRPKKPVLAMIYSHSHVDHFGGVRGQVDAGLGKTTSTGTVTLIAPTVVACNAVLQRAQAVFESGEYRWVAQVCAMVAHAGAAGDEIVAGANALGANALEQLGYQAESATWRNAFLHAVMEQRHGVSQLPPGSVAVKDIVRALPLGPFFDMLAMRLDGAKARGLRLRLNWQLSDSGESALLNLENSALTHRLGQLVGMLDNFSRMFPVVGPRP